ncbi:ArnT family glycosyltransferase [Chlamydiota bacterium]
MMASLPTIIKSIKKTTGFLLLLWVFFSVTLYYTHQHTQIALVFSGHLYSFAFLCLFFLVVTSFGVFILKKSIPLDSWFLILCGTGVGFSLFSFLVFFLGLCGLIDSRIYIVILCGCALLSRREMVSILRLSFSSLKSFLSDERSLFSRVFIGMLLLLMLLNLLNSLTPVLDYDVLEYHLGCLKEYLLQGKIGFISTNVYCSFPSHVEMVYLMFLKLGMNTLPKLIHCFFGIFSLGALYAFTRLKNNRETAILVGCLFYITGMISLLSGKALIDLGLVFYSVLAVGTFMVFLEKKILPLLIISGFFSGICLATKLTGIFVVIIPLIIVLFIARIQFKKVLLYVLCVCIVSLPWVIKSWVDTGNPVFPFLSSLFKTTVMSPEMSNRFFLYHFPQEGLVSGINNMWHSVGVGALSSPLILILFPFFFSFKKNRSELFLFIYVISASILWAFVTRKALRFLMPVLPFYWYICGVRVYALKTHSIIKTILKMVIISVFIMSMCVSFLLVIELDSLSYFFRIVDKDTYLTKKLPHFQAVSYINEHISSQKTVLYIGEARTFYVNAPVSSGTFFNDTFFTKALKEGASLERLYSLLYENNVEFILVNTSEIKRLGKQSNGDYFADIDFKKLKLFFEKYAVIEFKDSKNTILVFRVKEKEM